MSAADEYQLTDIKSEIRAVEQIFSFYEMPFCVEKQQMTIST